jgi:DNA mismatch repair protein MutS2
MLFPSTLEEKLGFDTIKELVASSCKTFSGRNVLENSLFSADISHIEREGRKIQEVAALLSDGLSFPVIEFQDVTEVLQKAKVEGVYISEAEFFELRRIMQASKDLKLFFQKYSSENSGESYHLASELIVDEHFTKELVRIIDESGKVSDFASQELKEIRKNLGNLKTKVRRKLDDMLKFNQREGITEEEHNITVRDGRLVIPVRAEYKRQIKSIIHDESASGQTAFVEPVEILEDNNKIRELELDEKREIIRLLMHLAELLRHNRDAIVRNVDILGEFDLLFAKLRFAEKTHAIFPKINSDKKLVLRNAFHPIMRMNHEATGKKTVPFSLELDPSKRILVVSGPNAGGKSVTLKTVGLLQYMFQCGLPVPVEEGSSLPVFDHIFADIGDEQSIENELSTYSSHLRAMKFMLGNSDENTLVLLDEFGTGTDPQYGGAIAQAVLEELNIQKVFGMVNTHFSNLKKMADETAGMMNACMLFDEKSLSPTYQLQVGVPGNSYALEVAQKIGLHANVIQKTKDILGEDFVQFESISKNLKSELDIYRKKNKEVEEKNTRLTQLTQQYNDLKAEVDKNRKLILNQAKSEAARIIEESNKKIENTIRLIKENAADKEKTKVLRAELDEFKATLVPERPKPVPKSSQKEALPIQVGDYVHIDGSESAAEVLAIKGNEAEVSIGSIKSFVKTSRLEKASKHSTSSKKTYSNPGGLYLVEKRTNLGFQIDIRGYRADEAISKMDSVVDQAILVGQNELRIVHGKGNGVLRKVVREHLKQFKEIQHMEDEHADRGGDGVTIVRLR